VKDDPCFRCTLLDCDDSDQRCELRKLKKSYDRKIRGVRQRDSITSAERAASMDIWQAWHLERAAAASEGGRPYQRGGRNYGQEASDRP